MPLVEVEVYGVRCLVERDRLEVKDVFAGETDNSRATATEWYLDGKLVRRDCAVSVLRGQAISGDQATI
jgi:hypothetical protein